MTRRSYSGNARPTILAADLQVTDVALALADGTNYPDGTTGPFVLTIDLGLAGEEKVLATSRSGTAVSGLIRGFDGTVAGRHSSGAPVAHTISAVDMDEANAHVNNPNDPHPQYLTDAEGNAAYTPLAHVTAADPHTQYLTTARGDALFLTPAEGDALFLTPAEGDAAYAPKSHSDAIMVGTDPHPQYTTAAELATAIAATGPADPTFPSGWTPPTLQQPLQVKKSHNGTVHLFGSANNVNAYQPSGTIVVCTLPAAYRPPKTIVGQGSWATANPGTNSFDYEIRTDGTVRSVRSSTPGVDIPATSLHSFQATWSV